MKSRQVAPDEVFPVSRKWQAEWITGAGDGPAENVFRYYRTEFDLDAVPAQVVAFVSADTRYQLYVNGRFVGRGVPPCQRRHQYYDERDLTEFLAPGRNCIAAVVNHLGGTDQAGEGLLVEVTDGDGRPIVASGAGWRMSLANPYAGEMYRFRMNVISPYQELYDARKVSLGWDRPHFDDSDWAKATVLGRPHATRPRTQMVPRDIPDMTADPTPPVAVQAVEECLDIEVRTRWGDLTIGLSQAGVPLHYAHVEGAERLCTGGEAVVQCSTNHLDRVFDGIYDPCIVLDFGRVITAYPRLELDGVGGGCVDIGYAERLIDGHFNNAIEGQFADRYVMMPGLQSYQPFAWKAFRYLKLRFRSCFRPVTVRSVRAVVTTYPYEERGAFTSCDEQLNRVFELSRYTIRLCSNEFLMDTPWREQAQWLGDVSAVTLPGIYACFGDVVLPAKYLRQTAATQYPNGLLANVSNVPGSVTGNPLPDYSLWWVMGLWNHYTYTGYASWVQDLYPVAVRIVRAHLQHVNERGLLEDMPGRPFIDWADIDRRGECAAYNAILYGALEALGKMASLNGDTHVGRLVEDTRAAIWESFRERFYDPERGVLADGRIDGEFSPKTSEHANMAAVLWGLLDAETAAAVIRRLYEEKSVPCTEAQPFFTSVVLRALDRAGRFDLAMDILRARWGRRMADRGATSAYEEWTTNGSWRSGEFAPIMRTLSHAWSAFPAEFLIRYLAGIEILEPGCGRVRVAPRDAGCDYALTYPTPKGPVTVRRRGGAVEVKVPDGVEVVDA